MQAALIAGYYRCQHCERDVFSVRRERRFRLCPECYAAIVPTAEPAVAPGQRRDEAWHAETEAVRDQLRRYWDWYHEMEKRYPARYALRSTREVTQRLTDDEDSLLPVCKCGRLRQPLTFTAGREPGLFGGPFAALCPVCEAKRSVETMIDMLGRIHPEWDDEDCLDALWKSHRYAFEAGVLPDYWYQLRQQEARNE